MRQSCPSRFYWRTVFSEGPSSRWEDTKTAQGEALGTRNPHAIASWRDAAKRAFCANPSPNASSATNIPFARSSKVTCADFHPPESQ